MRRSLLSFALLTAFSAQAHATACFGYLNFLAYPSLHNKVIIEQTALNPDGSEPANNFVFYFELSKDSKLGALNLRRVYDSHGETCKKNALQGDDGKTYCVDGKTRQRFFLAEMGNECAVAWQDLEALQFPLNLEVIRSIEGGGLQPITEVKLGALGGQGFTSVMKVVTGVR